MYVREFRDRRRGLRLEYVRFVLIGGALDQSVNIFFAKVQHDVRRELICSVFLSPEHRYL